MEDGQQFNSMSMFWCKNCLNTSTRPRITFDKRGFCSACQWSEKKKKLNWSLREKNLLSLIKKHIDLKKSYYWVVYPKNKNTQTLHLQVAGIWHPYQLNDFQNDFSIIVLYYT